MKNLMQNTPERSRLGALGHTVSEHTVEAGQKIRDEFDDVAPKVAAAASQAGHKLRDEFDVAAPKVAAATSHAAHVAMERSRPIRSEAASRGSAALSGLLGEVTPTQIERMSGRGARRGKIALLLAAAGGVAIWVLWWKRSDSGTDSWQEEDAKPDPEDVKDVKDGKDLADPQRVVPSTTR